MKKAINITISGTLFYIEEDAYQKLDLYLQSVKTHFAPMVDHEEIVADIESRIAETFLENGKARQHNIITIAEVEKVIASMGNAEDFDDEVKENGKSSEASTNTGPRKLYRDAERAVIAGVCAGLAAYFNVDPLVFRIIFIISLFLGGTGIVVYIILWLVIPEAKTATEKLQMRGEAVTLQNVGETVKETIKEKVVEVKKRKGSFHNFVAAAAAVIGGVIAFIAKLFYKIIVKGGGVILAAVSILLLFVSTFVLVITLFNIHSPYIDFPLAQFTTGPYYYGALIIGYIIVIVPAIFIFMLGRSLVGRRNAFVAHLSFTLLGLWFAAIIAGGAIGTRIAQDYQTFIITDPSYQQTTRNYDLKDFSSVEVENGQTLELQQGPQFSIEGQGRRRDLDRLDVSVSNGTLRIRTQSQNKICIFCIGGKGGKFTVTMPDLQTITARNGSVIQANNFTAGTLTIQAYNASRIILGVQSQSIQADMRNGSRLTLSGTSPQANYKLYNASILDANGLVSDNVMIESYNGSRGYISASKNLSVRAFNASIISYTGKPMITSSLSNGSRLIKAGDPLDTQNSNNQLPAPPIPAAPSESGQ